MKQIKVDCCKHCPFKDRWEAGPCYCTNHKRGTIALDDTSIIDPSCPLEDVKED